MLLLLVCIPLAIPRYPCRNFPQSHQYGFYDCDLCRCLLLPIISLQVCCGPLGQSGSALISDFSALANVVLISISLRNCIWEFNLQASYHYFARLSAIPLAFIISVRVCQNFLPWPRIAGTKALYADLFGARFGHGLDEFDCTYRQCGFTVPCLLWSSDY